MADRTSIEWCDATFNPWIGCTKISPGCDHCYAEKATPTRVFGVTWGAGQERRRSAPTNWARAQTWNARPFWQCSGCQWRGEGSSSYCPRCESGVLVPARRRVFCASLADVFDNEVDIQWRADLFALIRRTPNLDWLLLTKRIGLAAANFAISPGWIPNNVWLGATITSQAEADRDIPKLLAIPAAVRFLSMEPLLGRVDLCEHLGMWWNETMGCFESSGSRWNPNGLGWVIAGGESGTGARPMHPDWVRSLRNQCAAARVPFLFKQWGEWSPYTRPAGYDWRLPKGDFATWDGRDFRPFYPNLHEGVSMRRTGKKAAGRMLDGVEHNGFPAGHA